MIDIKSNKGKIEGCAYGSPAQINAELSEIVEHVLLGLGNSIPEPTRKRVLKMFLETIYDSALEEIEKL